MALSRRRTLLKQYQDPAEAHASQPADVSRQTTSGRRLPLGWIGAGVLLVVVALAAFMMLGDSRRASGQVPPNTTRTASVAEPAPVTTSPPVQAGPGPDSSIPGKTGERVGQEPGPDPRPQAAAAAPPATLPQAGPAEPPQAQSSPPPGDEPPITVAAAPGAAAAALQGVTESEIRLGIAAPFSGPSRELGRQMRLGIETAFNLANEAGGVHGRRLQLITADDGYEPARTLQAVKQLAEEQRVFGFIGNVGTPTAAVALPYALERRMLFFGAFTGANLLRSNPPDRYVFNYRPSYAEETEAAVRYLVRVRGLKPGEIAVFTQQDAYGDDGFAGAAKALRALQGNNVRPVLRLNYPRNTVEVTEAVAQLRAANPAIRAVVMVATYRAAAKFIERTRTLFPKMIYTNVSFVGSTALRDELMLLGPNFADGIIVTQVVPAVEGHSKAVLDYKAALAKFFPGEAPDYVSFEGYVDAQILIEALRRAGPQLDTEKLVDALESIKGLDLGLGTPISFGPSEHQGSHRVWGTQLDNAGRFKQIDLE